MIQVTKVWWDGEKLMAEPIDPTTIYQDPAQQEKCWNPTGEAHIAAIKKSSKAMVEDAVVRAAQKVMAEFEAKSDERLMKDWGPGPHEYHSLPAQQEPVAWMTKTGSVWKTKEDETDQPLYTSPPAQRTWVGLTDKEVMELAFNFDVPSLIVRTVEAKLKEKNT